MLAALNQKDSHITAYSAGADDFLAKPFYPDELLARVSSKILRNSSNFNSPPEIAISTTKIGNIKLDFSRLQMTISGKDVEISPTEF